MKIHHSWVWSQVAKCKGVWIYDDPLSVIDDPSSKLKLLIKDCIFYLEEIYFYIYLVRVVYLFPERKEGT